MGASGTAVLNFGAFPGSPGAEVDVAGQAGFVAGSEIEAWVQPVATADHSADEHTIEALEVRGRYKVDGTLTIQGSVRPFPQIKRIYKARYGEEQAHRLYGQWTVAWAWS